VFGPRWRPAVVASQVLCIWALMSPINMVCGNAFKSRGRADIQMWLAIPQGLAIIVGSLLVVHQGIVAVSWIQAGIAVIAQIIAIVITQRMFRLSTRSIAAALTPPALAAAALAIVLLAVNHAISAPWLAIIAGGAITLPIYGGVLHLLAPDLIPRLIAMAFPRKASGRTPYGERETALGAGDADSMVRPSMEPSGSV
jgi:O-antigen/teichoic acid export membrane protein